MTENYCTVSNEYLEEQGLKRWNIFIETEAEPGGSTELILPERFNWDEIAESISGAFPPSDHPLGCVQTLDFEDEDY